MSFVVNPYILYTPPTYSYNARSVNAGTSTAHTFTGLSIGAEDGNRFVVVGIGMRNGGAISSVTIAGNSATALVDSGTNAIGLAFYGLSVPTGTTADVVVNHDTNSTPCMVSSYSLYNLQSTTPFDTALSFNATPADISADTAMDAIVLGMVHQGNANTTTFTWTGLTERWDESAGVVNSWTGADGQMASAEAPRSISVSFSAAPVAYRGGALVVMR